MNGITPPDNQPILTTSLRMTRITTRFNKTTADSHVWNHANGHALYELGIDKKCRSPLQTAHPCSA
jgi:Zn-dependent M32 family carboxypeptidase